MEPNKNTHPAQMSDQDLLNHYNLAKDLAPTSEAVFARGVELNKEVRRRGLLPSLDNVTDRPKITSTPKKGDKVMVPYNGEQRPATVMRAGSNKKQGDYLNVRLDDEPNLGTFTVDGRSLNDVTGQSGVDRLVARTYERLLGGDGSEVGAAQAVAEATINWSKADRDKLKAELPPNVAQHLDEYGQFKQAPEASENNQAPGLTKDERERAAAVVNKLVAEGKLPKNTAVEQLHPEYARALVAANQETARQDARNAEARAGSARASAADRERRQEEARRFAEQAGSTRKTVSSPPRSPHEEMFQPRVGRPQGVPLTAKPKTYKGNGLKESQVYLESTRPILEGEKKFKVYAQNGQELGSIESYMGSIDRSTPNGRLRVPGKERRLWSVTIPGVRSTFQYKTQAEALRELERASTPVPW